MIFGLRFTKGCCGLNGWLCKGHFSALRSEGRKLKIRPGEGPFYGHDHKFFVILVGEDRLEAGLAHQIYIL